MSQQKRLIFAYFLWALGGWFGLHHVYLGRYRHAFLWATTIGGCFGLGWIRDIWRLPYYVSESNGGQDYVQRMIYEMKINHKPRFSSTRFIVQLVYGLLVGVTVVAGLPDVMNSNELKLITNLLVTLSTGLAVHLVANIGNEQASLKWVLGSAFAVRAAFGLISGEPGSGIMRCTLVAAISTNWKGKSWRRPSYRKSSKTLCLGLTFAAVLYFSLLGHALLHNTYITTSDGERVRLKEAIGNMMSSEAWQHPLDTIRLMWTKYGATGFDGSWDEFIEAIDPEGERNAYQVLGVPQGSSEKELHAAYKKLAKKYHPDRVSDPEEKLVQEQQFIAVQKAFDALSTIRNRRARANKVNQ